MDSLTTANLQESNCLDYFPSAVPASTPNLIFNSIDNQLVSFQSENPSQNPPSQQFSTNVKTKGSGSNSKEMAVIISVGPSNEPTPLMRYHFYKDTSSEETSYELVMKSKLIQSKFSNLILDICSLLQDSPTAYIEKLQMWLSFQSCSQSVQSLKAFDSDSSALKATSIPAFISSLRCYTSWYNYGLIADIAHHFCGDKGSAIVQAYKAELKDYLQMLIIHSPPLFPDHECTLQSLENFEMKVGCVSSMALLQDIAIFKHTLCQLCELDPRFLVIRRINATSNNFQMSWAIPKAATRMVKEAIKSKSDSFSQIGVETIKIADSQIEFKKKYGLSTQFDLSKKRTRCSFKDEPHRVSIRRTHSEKCGTEKEACNNISYSGSSADGKGNNSKAKSEPHGHVPSEFHVLRWSRKHPHKSSRLYRDKKALSIGTALPSDENPMDCSSLLSEITRTLKVSSLLSYDTLPSSEVAKQRTESNDINKSTGEESLQDEVFRDEPVNSMDGPSTRHLNSTTKTSVSFLWRILGRARHDCHANIYIVSIQTIRKFSQDDIEVRKGQHLKALYRVTDKVFVETQSLEKGLVPYSCCRLARKHYGSQSKLIQLSYLRLYPQSPDGTDTLPSQEIHAIKMVAIKHYSPGSQEELHAQSNQTFTVLYCDSAWIYAISDKQQGGLLPRSVCKLSQESHHLFKRWQQDEQLFQSDFIMKYDEERPTILDESPVSVSNSIQRISSKVGKIFTIVQNFVPTSPTSGNFTIRKGLKVKVMKESGQQVCVTTKSGVSFWIPQTHVRPARKNSNADKFM